MKKERKWISLLMAVLLFGLEVCGAWTLPAYAAADDSVQSETENNEEEKTTETMSDDSAIEVKGDGSVGDVIAQEISQEYERNQAETHIGGITVENGKMQVSYASTVDGFLVGAVYDNDGSVMTASGQMNITADDNGSAEIELEGEIPEYFQASAYILDSETRQPLCESYTTTYYTEAIQNLKNKTAEDFIEEDKEVVYLDTDVEGNKSSESFAVYREDTVSVKEDGENNVLSQESDGTWVFSNADDTVKSLKEGNIVSYWYKDGMLEAFRIGTLVIDGNQVRITEGDSIGLLDIFECVKIQSDGEGSTLESINTAGMSEGVTFAGVKEKSSDRSGSIVGQAMQTDSSDFAVQKEDKDEKEKEGEIKVSYDGDSAGVTFNISKSVKREDSVDSKIEGEAEITFSNFQTDFLLDDGVTFVKSAVDWDVGINIKVSGELEAELKFATMKFKILPAVHFSVTPSFNPSISGAIELKLHRLGTFGSIQDGKNTRPYKTEQPENDVTIRFEGELFLGFKFEVSAEILSKKCAYIEFEVSSGLNFKAEEKMDSLTINNKKKHACAKCLSGNVALKTKVTFHIYVKKVVDKTNVVLELKIPSYDFYWSIDYDDFEKGDCPHYLYKTDLLTKIKDEDGEVKILEGADIRISELELTKPENGSVTKNEILSIKDYKSDENGLLTVWLAEGKYAVTAEKDGNLMGKAEFEVKENQKQHEVILEARKYSVQFNVKDIRGYALEGAEITVQNDKISETKKTSKYGYEQFRLLPGTYDVTVTYGEEQEARFKFEKNEEDQQMVDVQLHGPSRTITIKTVDKDGNPVKNATVTSDVMETPQTTDEDGTTVIYLADGIDYVINADADGLSGSVTFTVDGEDMEVTCVMHQASKITVKVVGTDGDVFPFITVTATCLDDSESQKVQEMTDESGQAVFKLKKGYWEISAEQGEMAGEERFAVYTSDDTRKLEMSVKTYNVKLKSIYDYKPGDSIHFYVNYQIYSEADGTCNQVNGLFCTDNKAICSLGQMPKGRYFAYVEGKYGFWFTVDGTSNQIIQESYGSVDVSVSGTTMTISGNGTVPKLNVSYYPDITSIKIKEGVVGIGADAFDKFSSVESIELPDSLVFIGSGAFSDCNVKEMTLPRNVRFAAKWSLPYTLSKLKLNCRYLMEENSRTAPELIIGESVEKIRDYEFKGSEISYLEIQTGADDIGGYVFEDCKSLEKVKFSESVEKIYRYMFSDCSKLEQVEIPDSVKMIDTGAFSRCTSLEQIEIPDSVEMTDEGVFSDCKKLTQVKLPVRLETLASGFFSGCESLAEIEIPDSVQTIGEKAFAECTSLEAIDIPDSVKCIEEEAFKGTPLRTLTVPEAVENFSISAVKSCEKLESLTVLGDIQKFNLTIDNRNTALKELTVNAEEIVKCYAPALEKVVFRENTKKIEDGAFNWSSIREMRFEGDMEIETLPENLFKTHTNLETLKLPDHIKMEKLESPMPESLVSVEISEGITEIGESVFAGCVNLSKVKLPESLKNIGKKAFSGCSVLKEVDFPENLERIGTAAFENCTSIEAISLNKNLDITGGMAFAGCINLKEAFVAGSSQVSFIGDTSHWWDTDTFYAHKVFMGCTNLEQLTVSSAKFSFETSGYNALKKLDFQDTINSIKVISDGEDNLNEILLSDTVQEVECRKCRNLREIVLPESVQKVNFEDCTNLKNVRMPYGVREIVSFAGCTSLETIELPETVETIGTRAFFNCRSLKKISIPEKVQKIEEATFCQCENLEEVDLGKVTEIGFAAFNGCKKIKDVIIPETVTVMDRAAFERCGVQTICFLGKKLPEGTAFSFSYVNEVEPAPGGGFYFDSDPEYKASCMEDTDKEILVFYPTEMNIDEDRKFALGLKYCTWIPYDADDLSDLSALAAKIETTPEDVFADQNETESFTNDENAADESEIIADPGEDEITLDGQDTDEADDAFTDEVEITDDTEETDVQEDEGDIEVYEIEPVIVQTLDELTTGEGTVGDDTAEDTDKQRFDYSGLIENSYCLFAVVKDKEAENLFAHENLIYIDQKTSDDDGNVSFYCGKESLSDEAEAVIYAPYKTYNLEDAEITVKPMSYTGEKMQPEVTVNCGGETLSEGTDYVLRGDTEVTDAGEYTLNVLGRGDYSGKKEFTYYVEKIKRELTVKVSSKVIEKGRTVAIQAECDVPVTYASRQPEIATVDAKGNVKGISTGVATIVVAAEGDQNHAETRKTVRIIVNRKTVTEPTPNPTKPTPTVKPTPSASKKSTMKLNASSLTLKVKQKTSAFRISGMVSGDYVKSVTSGNTQLLKVNKFTKTGSVVLSAQKKTGKTTLTIRLAKGATRTITVKIQKKAVNTKKIAGLKKTLTLKKGKNYTLKPVLNPITSQDKIKYSSSNNKVATVSSKGVIKAKKPGKAKITVKSGKKKYIITVTVKK